LKFTGDSLEKAVAEYNRYLTHKIVVTDPASKALRVRGRFDTHNSKEFLAALKTSFNINAQDTGEVTILMR
jgi:transmembrane sensor